MVELIADRIHAERDRRRWTLTQLADASGVSRAMINRIERGESSPTAVILGKLSGAFQLSIAELLTPPGATPPSEAVEDPGVRRAGDAAQWQDPVTGYRRRQITGPRFPAQVAEIHLPPGARVPYPAAAYAFIRQTIWVLAGRLTFTEGDTVHELAAGDTLELGAPTACEFANTTTAACRYAVILVHSGRP